MSAILLNNGTDTTTSSTVAIDNKIMADFLKVSLSSTRRLQGDL